MLKIQNYKVIRSLERLAPFKLATLVYGFNGVGKSKLTELITGLYNGKKNELLDQANLNVNSPGESIICDLDIFEDGNTNAEIFCFNEDYISQHLFINKRIDTKEIFSVIFSPKKIDSVKEGFRTSQTELEGILKSVGELVLEVGNLDFFEKVLKIDHTYASTFSSVTQSVTDKQVDKKALDEFLDRQTEDNYPKWWLEGFNSYWTSTKTQCIFCDMTIDKTASLFEILKNKSSGKKLDILKRNEYILKLNNASSLLSEEYKKVVVSLVKIITVASFTDDEDKQLELQAIGLKIKDIKLAVLGLKSIQERATGILLEIKEQKIEELPLLDKGLCEVFNTSIQGRLSSLGGDVQNFNKKATGINSKINVIREEFKKMLEEKETLFIDLLRTFNLKYKVALGNLDTTGSNVDFLLHIAAEDDSNNRLVPNTSPEEVLSFGEVHSIAFIFFLISIYSKLEDNDRAIIIMDDPISSHDSFRKYTTAGIISKLATKLDPAKHRLIVLTHEEGFCRSLFYSVKSFTGLQAKFDFLKFKNKKGHCQLDVLKDDDFKIYAKKIVGFINDPSNNEIARLAMIRLLLEFDRSFDLENYGKLNGYLCEVLHSRPITVSKIADAINEYSGLKGKYNLSYDINNLGSHYEQIRNQLLTNVKAVNVDGEYTLDDINRFLVSRVVVENYLKTVLHLSGRLSDMMSNITDADLKGLVESNISLLNVIVHDDEDTMRPGLDFKDIDLVGMEPIDSLYNLLV